MSNEIEKNTNISDNLRYFPEAPKSVKFWKRKYEFNLALSVIINSQSKKCAERIEYLQEEIKNQLKNTETITDPYKIKRGGLYRYPPGDLHFTLINFLKCRLNNKDKVKRFKKLLEHTNYEKIKKQISNIVKTKIKQKIKADLRWIYSGDKGEIDSFSLQAFPEAKLMKKLDDINEEAEKKTYEIPCNTIGIKAYPEDTPRAFIINILRFMEGPKQELIEETIKDDKIRVLNIIEKINREHNDEPFFPNLTIKELFLVESDPFLHKHKNIETFPLK